MMRVAGFVLTGGRSSRMGRDKALLPIDRQTLCERVGDRINTVAEKVLLVGRPERYAHLKYECVADLHPGLGPLSGLETALCLRMAEFNVVVSCDALNVTSEWLSLLLAAAESGAKCVVAQDAGGHIQPLCGIYRSSCEAAVERALRERRLRMTDLLRELDARTVKMEGVLLNLNTPEDWDGIVNADKRG